MKKQSEKSKRNEAKPAVLSRGRLWIFRLMALLLPVILLAAVEICLRIGGYGYDPHFFKRIRIGGGDYYVQNDDFSLRFFPPETARFAGPIRMPVHKPPGTFRIFIFGESAAMGDPEPAYGACRYLEMLLREKYPDKKFEVINVAYTAINSHVILPIARECAAHEGDLWIIYMGNNEMVGPYGAATVFGRQAPPLPYVRLITAAQAARIGQWAMAISRKMKSRGTGAASWQGMQMFLQNQVAPDSPLKENVYRNFQKNLDDIVRAGIGSGAKILLNTMAVNLKDCPPFASLTNGNLSGAESAQFDKLLSEARAAEAQPDFPEAVQKFQEASKIDAKFADLQFRWGECLLAQKSLVEARGHLQLACDDDALPFRADSRINAAIRDEPKKIRSNDLILFDAATSLATGTAAGACGQETFYEHVHFDFDGSYRLALAWAGQIEPMLPRNTNAWASQAICEQMLGLSDWNRALVSEQMMGRMQQPPLNGQANNAARLEMLQARVNQLRRQMSADNATQTREIFLKELARAPEDYVLRENFAVFLQSSGDLAGAVAEWRRISELIPQDYLARFQIGRLLGEQKQPAEAEASLRTALAIRPSFTEGWIELGQVLALQKKFTEALANYATAQKQRPQDSKTIVQSGKVLAQTKRHAEAVEAYRAAIKLNPADWEAHFELGGELDAANQPDAASVEFGEAVRLNPNNSRTHFNHGVLLAKQKRFDEAEREFKETIRLEPGYGKAQAYLAQLQAMKKRGP